MMTLPNQMLRSRWVSADCLPKDIRAIADAEFHRCNKAPGWNPKAIKLRRDLHMIDVSASEIGSGVLGSVHLALVRDHPFLTFLNAMGNVPRVVKALYRKEVRLAHYRGTDILPVLQMLHRADDAWAKYSKASK